MARAGVLLHRTRKDNTGTRSYYRLSEGGTTLLFSRGGTTQKSDGYDSKVGRVRLKSRNIDSSIIDSSIIDNKTSSSADDSGADAIEPTIKPSGKKTDAETALGKEAKQCLDYYFQEHLRIRGFEPMIDGARDMTIFKRFLNAGYTEQAIKQVTTFFMDYPKRTKFTTRALYNSFDTLYGVLRDKAAGKR